MKSVIVKNLTDSTVMTSPEYQRFIEDLKARVLSARISAARSINGEGTLLYWDIGRAIVEKQRVLGWGESVINRVSFDLRKAFPDSIGFSPRNLRDMRRFYLTYADEAIWRQLVAKLSGAPAAPNLEPSVPETGLVAKWRQPVAKVRPEDNVIQFLRLLAAEIPWGQNLLILNKLTAPAARLWYLQATARFGWTRNVLLNQIKAGAYERAVTDKKTHNFDLALPEHLAEQADEMLKSSYNLEFLGLRRAVKERELEDRLVGRLRDFLLELGYGFCFIGRQHWIELGKKEYFIDLLPTAHAREGSAGRVLEAGTGGGEDVGALDERMVARRTGTPLVLRQGGRVEKRWLEGEGQRPDGSPQVRPLAAQQGL